MTATIDPDSTLVTSPEITAYVDAVRVHLDDIDRDEVDDLVDDVELHLIEVRSETDEPFEQVVGSPQAFAAELRQSAGLGAAPPPSPSRGRLAAASDRVSRTVSRATAAVGRNPWARSTLNFLPELRPAWWVIRGFLLAILMAFVTTSQAPVTGIGTPRIAGSGILGLAVTVALVVGSIRFGKAAYQSRWARMASAATAALAVLAATSLPSIATYRDGRYNTHPYIEAGAVEAVIERDFTILPANVYAFRPDGTPIEQFLLYNEVGQPVDLPIQGYSEWLGSDFEALTRTNFYNQAVPNLYPRELRAHRFDGFDDGFATIAPPEIDRFPLVDQAEDQDAGSDAAKDEGGGDEPDGSQPDPTTTIPRPDLSVRGG